MANAMQINGRVEISPAPEGETLAELLNRHQIGQTARGIAVAVNGAVIRRALWPTHRVGAGDAIEIVRAFQGG